MYDSASRVTFITPKLTRRGFRGVGKKHTESEEKQRIDISDRARCTVSNYHGKITSRGNLGGRAQFAAKLHCLTGENKEFPHAAFFLRQSRGLSNGDPRGVFIIPGAKPFLFFTGEKLNFLPLRTADAEFRSRWKLSKYSSDARRGSANIC